MNPAYISGIRASADGTRFAFLTMNSQGPRLVLASLRAVETLYSALPVGFVNSVVEICRGNRLPRPARPE